MTAPAEQPARYRVTFDRVGRHHDVKPIVVEGDRIEVMNQIYRYVRPKLGSRDVDVDVFPTVDGLRGVIFVGVRNGGTFSLEVVHGV